MPPANKRVLDDLIDDISRNLPEQLEALRDELSNNFKPVLQGALTRLDLVTRDEFDAQSRLLATSRAKLDSLQEQLKQLEKDLQGK